MALAAKTVAKRHRVNYDFELACRDLTAADPKLGTLIARSGTFVLKVKSAHSPFEALLESIIYQQLHGRAAATILGRLLTSFGEVHPSPREIIAAPEEIFRAAGVSRSKELALRDLAAKTLDGTVPTLQKIRRMPEDEIIRRLVEVRGIGQWTVEMLLIFRLSRPDVLPVTDFGVRKGFALTFGKLKPKQVVKPELLPTPAVMLRRGERWRPWRSVASWYLWRACDLASAIPTQPE